MNYIDVLRESEDMVTPGMSACQGCGGELILRTVLQVAGKNTIIGIPPGCMAGAGVVGWNYSNGLKIPVHIPLLDNTASFLTGRRCLSGGIRDYKPFLSEGKQGRRGYHADDPVLWADRLSG